MQRRRYAAITVVLVGAVASIATSPIEWHLNDSAVGTSLLIDASTPTQSARFNVRAEGIADTLLDASVHVAFTLTSTATPSNAPASIRLSLVPDGDGEPTEQILQLNPNQVGETSLYLGMFETCTEFLCQQSFTVVVERLDATLEGTTNIAWTATVDMYGDGDEPEAAFLEVTLETL